MSQLLSEIKKFEDAVANRESPEKIEKIVERKKGLVEQLKGMWANYNRKNNNCPHNH